MPEQMSIEENMERQLWTGDGSVTSPRGIEASQIFRGFDLQLFADGFSEEFNSFMSENTEPLKGPRLESEEDEPEDEPEEGDDEDFDEDNEDEGDDEDGEEDEDEEDEDEEDEELDDEEEEDEDEEEDAEENKSKNAKAKKAKETASSRESKSRKEPIVKPIAIDPKLKPQFQTVEQAYGHFYNEALIALIKQEISEEKLKEFKDMDELAATAGPRKWTEWVEGAKYHAQKNAQTFLNESLNPWIKAHTHNRLAGFVDKLEKKFPDVRDYWDRMCELSKGLCEEFDEFENNPLLAIPTLYAMAKTERMTKGAKKDAKRKQKKIPKTTRGGGTKTHTSTKKKDYREATMKRIRGDSMASLAAIFS